MDHKITAESVAFSDSFSVEISQMCLRPESKMEGWMSVSPCSEVTIDRFSWPKGLFGTTEYLNTPKIIYRMSAKHC
jgi:hypothetical protein